MKENRNHPLYVVKQIFNLIRQAIFPIALVFLTQLERTKGWMVVGGALLVFLLLVVLAFLSWKNTVYGITEGVLHYEKGILNKTKQGVAIDKITTINESQELVERLFGLVTFKVDAGSATKGNEIKLTLGRKAADDLLEQLGRDRQQKVAVGEDLGSAQVQKAQAQKVVYYTITPKELALYAVASNSFLTGVAAVFAVLQFGDDIPFVKRQLAERIINPANAYLQTVASGLSVGMIIAAVTVLLVLYLILSFGISVMMTVIKYFGFTAQREGHQIEIHYGLLSRAHYKVDINKMTALYIQYGLLGQFMHLGSLKIESIGYGDERGESAILYPIIHQTKLKALIGELLPEYALVEQMMGPPRKARLSYLIKWVVPVALAALIATFALPYGAFSWIAVGVMVIVALLMHHKTRLAVGVDRVVVSGGVFGKWTAVVKSQHIQSMRIGQSYFQKRSGLMHLTFGYQSNVFGKTVGVQFMDESCLKAIHFPEFSV